MSYQYCIRKNGLEDSQKEQTEEEQVKMEDFEFEDAFYQWDVDEIDRENSEAEILLDVVHDTVMLLNNRYPHLRTEALKGLLKNLKNPEKLSKDVIQNLCEGVKIEGFYDINLVLRKMMK